MSKLQVVLTGFRQGVPASMISTHVVCVGLLGLGEYRTNIQN